MGSLSATSVILSAQSFAMFRSFLPAVTRSANRRRSRSAQAQHDGYCPQLTQPERGAGLIRRQVAPKTFRVQAPVGV